MIQIKNTKDILIVGGHANYDKHGKDIVCSAVSILVLTLERGLKERNNDLDYELSSGRFLLRKNGLSEDSNILISSFLMGVDILIEMYPEYITRLGSE